MNVEEGYSVNALSVRHRFFNSNYIVYVEGPDDVEFWNHRFGLFSSLSVKIEVSPGGSSSLEPLIQGIIHGDGTYLVACDKDYSDLLGAESHPQVIRTYGYSIENTMYCPKNINEFIRKRSYSQKYDNLTIIQQWYDEFCEKIEELLILDIANEFYSRSESIMGDSSEKFLHKNSPNLDVDFIRDYLSEKNTSFSEDEINEIQKLLECIDKHKRFYIRGHFWTGAIRNFIKKEVLKIRDVKSLPISNDDMHNMTVGFCSTECGEVCQDFHYIRNCIKKAEESLAS